MARMKKRALRRKDGVWDPLADSSQSRQRALTVPVTPQSASPSYRLAYIDDDFLCREELRPVRLQLELLKTEMMLEERGINSTVVMFGGARIPSPAAMPGRQRTRHSARTSKPPRSITRKRASSRGFAPSIRPSCTTRNMWSSQAVDRA